MEQITHSPSEKVKLTRWPADRLLPTAEELNQFLTGEGVNPFLMVDPPFSKSQLRTPTLVETCWLLEGKLILQVDGGRIELRAGDRVDILPGARHRIQVASEDGAVYFFAKRAEGLK